MFSFLFEFSCWAPGPRTSLLLFLSLPFRVIHVGTPTTLEGGSGRSGPDLLLFLRDILVALN